MNIQCFPDGSAGVRCIIIRIIDIYTYIDSPGFFMDQTSATGPKYRQHNLMGVNYPPTFTLPTDADDIDVSVSDGGVEIPGLDPDDVEIKASGDMLTIRGEKKSEEKDDNHYERYFVMPGR